MAMAYTPNLANSSTIQKQSIGGILEIKHMLHRLIIILSVSLLCTAALADQANRIAISADYAKTGAIVVNDEIVSGDRVLRVLSKLIEAQGRDMPLAVVLPESLRFADWNNVRGLIDKVGFMQVRYLVRWKSTGKMIEFRQVGEAIDSL
jgi:hypothetical protein